MLSRFFLRNPATRAYYDQFVSRPDYSIWKWLHGYVYGRWPELYIALGTGRHPLARALRPLSLLFRTPKPAAGQPGPPSSGRRTFADTYHGKVLLLDHARKLVTVNRDIDLGDLEQVVPYAAAREIVLRHPNHILALDCPCRASSPNPCVPVGVCLIVGEPFAGFIAAHHPDKSRWITQDEAQEILKAEHDRGHVHHAFFKDVMLGRFYAICNCCSCCCGALRAHRGGTPMLASSGYVCVMDRTLCLDCGLCAKQCQFRAIQRRNKEWEVNAVACMGCGVCIPKCPQAALNLVRAPHRGEPLDIQEIMTRRDLS
ncbi:P-loop NTPase family protein [Desulfonatronum thiodismutans]|uniref:4Fe-4S dicluster domain-containing protein n=1 Tax=Desulfonatronum thiodismutans TaxID=159290 RepID=UPI0004ABDC9D|nr:4Fe-4S dicluster domain-containing protein [Desulfonatronum thiodismutans]